MNSSGTSAEAQGDTAGKAGPLPFDTTRAHQARVYDYLLGGKDNISQVGR